jgi:hypothetical protein
MPKIPGVLPPPSRKELAIATVPSRWRGTFKRAIEGEEDMMLTLAQQIARWDKDSNDLSWMVNPEGMGR